MEAGEENLIMLFSISFKIIILRTTTTNTVTENKNTSKKYYSKFVMNLTIVCFFCFLSSLFVAKDEINPVV